MIHVILRGDLGNQLFEYAVGRKLALQHDTDLILNLSNRLSPWDWRGRRLLEKLRYFDLKARFHQFPPLFTRVCHSLRLSRYLSTGTYFREKQWGFDPDVLRLPDHAYLFGYFQSQQYFQDMAPIIRADLSLTSLPKPHAVLAMADKIAQTDSVSLHVRRGDYLKTPAYHICTSAYYANAVNFMRKQLDQPRFFVFSDDIDWCRANLEIEDCDFVALPSPHLQPMHDFWLMSQCQHNIIANSTFSWWAAWLNVYSDKIIVTPNRWSQREPLNTLALQHTVPSEWIRIAV